MPPYAALPASPTRGLTRALPDKSEISWALRLLPPPFHQRAAPQGIGTYEELPRVLRTTGVINNRRMPKREAEKMVHEAWAAKDEAEAAGGLKVQWQGAPPSFQCVADTLASNCSSRAACHAAVCHVALKPCPCPAALAQLSLADFLWGFLERRYFAQPRLMHEVRVRVDACRGAS